MPTFHTIWTRAAKAEYPAPLSKELFQSFEHVLGICGQPIGDALQRIDEWLDSLGQAKIEAVELDGVLDAELPARVTINITNSHVGSLSFYMPSGEQQDDSSESGE